MKTKVFKVTGARQPAWQLPIAALEATARYPLGDDSFRLDHGADYFAFFRRLGALHYYAAQTEGRVAAVGAGIIRRVPFQQGGRARRTWYLCDLKVDPQYRGRRLPQKLMSRAFLPGYLRCRRGYAISMNPPDRTNRVVHLLERFRWARIRLAGQLLIYSVDAETMRRLQPVLESHRGPVSYLSLAGKKDLILGSTGARVPLIHAQFGPCAESGAGAPVAGHTHMFCAPDDDALARAVSGHGIVPSATAAIVAHGMEPCDWRFVLTSDI